jgi:hypothetical protein
VGEREGGEGEDQGRRTPGPAAPGGREHREEREHAEAHQPGFVAVEPAHPTEQELAACRDEEDQAPLTGAHSRAQPEGQRDREDEQPERGGLHPGFTQAAQPVAAGPALLQHGVREEGGAVAEAPQAETGDGDARSGPRRHDGAGCTPPEGEAEPTEEEEGLVAGEHGDGGKQGQAEEGARGWRRSGADCLLDAGEEAQDEREVERVLHAQSGEEGQGSGDGEGDEGDGPQPWGLVGEEPSGGDEHADEGEGVEQERSDQRGARGEEDEREERGPDGRRAGRGELPRVHAPGAAPREVPGHREVDVGVVERESERARGAVGVAQERAEAEEAGSAEQDHGAVGASEGHGGGYPSRPAFLRTSRRWNR